MGQKIGFSSRCGYHKSFFLGSGMDGRQENVIRKNFTEFELSAFNQLMEAGQLSQFLLEYRLAKCGRCDDLIAIPVLCCTLTNGTAFEFPARCKACGDPVMLLSTPYLCPKCGDALLQEIQGLWD